MFKKVPTIIKLLPTDIVNLKGIYMPGDVTSNLVRRSVRLFLYLSSDLHFIHSFKFNFGKDSTGGRTFKEKTSKKCLIC